MIKLRPNQIQPVQKGIDFFKEPAAVPSIIVAPTAAGKSIIIAKIVEGIDDKVICLQPSLELLHQNHSKYSLIGGKASIYSASAGQKNIGNVTYATIGSIVKLGEQFKNQAFTKLIIDECDRYPREENGMLQRFITSSGITHVLGLTATPLKLQNNLDQEGNTFSKLVMLTSKSKKGQFFKEIIHVTQVSEMVEAGFWSKLEYEQYTIDESGLKYNSTKADYTEESLKAVYESNNITAKIIQKIKDMPQRKSIIVFVPSVKEAITLSGLVPNSVAVYGDMGKKEREHAVNFFKKGMIRVAINVNVLCLDSKTEILTSKGWATIDTITNDDEVANWNTDGAIFFEKPKNVVIRDTKPDEFFVYVKSKEMDFRVTSNHDMVIRSQFKNKKIWKKVRANTVINKRIEVPTCGLCESPTITVSQEIESKTKLSRRISANSYNLRKSGISFEESQKEALNRIECRNNLKYKNPNELSNDECWLIGFWIGDGSVGKNKSSQSTCYSLAQAFRYPNIIKEIDGVLNRLNINYNSYVTTPKNPKYTPAIKYNLSLGTGFGDQNKSGIYHLIPYLDKKGSQYLRGLNKEQLKSLITGFWYADGNHGLAEKVPNSLHISNTNFALLSFIQELCITKGFSTNITTNTRSKNLNHSQLYHLLIKFNGDSLRVGWGNQKIEKEIIQTTEKVWCVESTSGIIITRRNGKVCIVGNSVGFDHPEIDTIICARPTASLAWLYQALGRGTRIHPNKKDCLIVDFSGNVKKFGRIEHLTFVKENIWKLYGEGGNLLTGIPLHTIGEHTKETESAPKKILMPFGKHQGKEIKDIDKNYRSWMLQNFTWNDRTMKIKKEIERLNTVV